MRKLSFLAVFLIALTATLGAQATGSQVTGTVLDEQGAAIPGAAVTLHGSDATFHFTTAPDGGYRFVNIEPGTYRVSAELAGFAPASRDLIVAAGRSVEAAIVLRIAPLAESVTVAAPAPMLDARTTGAATTIARDELRDVPTARDPFSLVRTVPGVLLDRVNVGGNETGQAPTVVSKGTRPQDTVWTLDGIVITDMAAAGLSPTYFNFDNFEEIQVSTAGQDIKQATGGVGINLITKRGTNQFHGLFRGYFANEALESANVPDELRALGVTAATADHDKQLAD